MSCAMWEERVALFAGGDLETAEAAAVERHLSRCAACSALAADLRSELDELRAAHSEPLAAEHFATVRGRVLAELAEPPRRRAVWAWAAALGVAAAGACVVWVPIKPVAAPVPELPRLVAVAPMMERPVPREPGSNRPLERHERTGWQAKAPAPPANESSGGKVGQTFSSVNQRVDPIILAAAQEPPVRMVQLATADPNVVIYWLFEEKGEER
ncbi:MAG: anti-sigma factor family protein [Bryobacteraceae bacterium]